MVNKVILIGNVGKDPESRTFENGNKVVNFSLATSENYKDKSGEWQQKTEWHNVTIYGQLAERAESMTKGATLFLEGKIQTRKWTDKEGNDRYTTEIVANYFRPIRKPGETQGAAPQSNEDRVSLPF